MGKIGPGDNSFETRSKVMQNHAIFHDAFGRFYNRYLLDNVSFFVMLLCLRWLSDQGPCSDSWVDSIVT